MSEGRLSVSAASPSRTISRPLPLPPETNNSLYSPECVEGGFSELRLSIVPRRWATKRLSSRLRPELAGIGTVACRACIPGLRIRVMVFASTTLVYQLLHMVDHMALFLVLNCNN